MQPGCGIIVGMNTIERLKAAIARRDEAVEAVYEAIADAVRNGDAVQEVAEVAGYHRNHIGRIARERGVPDARRRKAGE